MADINTLYQPSGDCHPNYIQHCAFDDCFVISDRNPNLFVKFKRDGTLLWQFGGGSAKGDIFSTSESWQVNHGFELEEDGRFVFFNDESTMSASKSWEKNTSSSGTLANVQRLSDDHYLVTASNAGKIEELDSSQNVVLTFSAPEFGYSNFRESLYGPPNDY